MVSTAREVLSHPVNYTLIDRGRHDAPEYLPNGFDMSLVEKEYLWTDLGPFRALPRGNEIRVRQAGIVPIHRANFPIWRVTQDGLPILHKGRLINFDAQPGIYRLERVTMWQERAGLMTNMVTAPALLRMQFSRMYLCCSATRERPHPSRNSYLARSVTNLPFRH